MSENYSIVNDSDALSRIGRWIASWDTGTSSETIVAIALGATEGAFSEPYDGGDFGRCYRLIEKVPELKNYFGKVSAIVPGFKPILDNWDELSKIHKEGGSVSKRMNELVDRAKESECS